MIENVKKDALNQLEGDYQRKIKAEATLKKWFCRETLQKYRLMKAVRQAIIMKKEEHLNCWTTFAAKEIVQRKAEKKIEVVKCMDVPMQIRAAVNNVRMTNVQAKWIQMRNKKKGRKRSFDPVHDGEYSSDEEREDWKDKPIY